MLHIYLNFFFLFILFKCVGGLAAYFKAYPTVKFVNKTIISPQRYPIVEPKENYDLGLGIKKKGKKYSIDFQ